MCTYKIIHAWIFRKKRPAVALQVVFVGALNGMLSLSTISKPDYIQKRDEKSSFSLFYTFIYVHIYTHACTYRPMLCTHNMVKNRGCFISLVSILLRKYIYIQEVWERAVNSLKDTIFRAWLKDSISVPLEDNPPFLRKKAMSTYLYILEQIKSLDYFTRFHQKNPSTSSLTKFLDAHLCDHLSQISLKNSSISPSKWSVCVYIYCTYGQCVERESCCFAVKIAVK